MGTGWYTVYILGCLLLLYLERCTLDREGELYNRPYTVLCHGLYVSFVPGKVYAVCFTSTVYIIGYLLLNIFFII